MPDKVEKLLCTMCAQKGIQELHKWARCRARVIRGCSHPRLQHLWVACESDPSKPVRPVPVTKVESAALVLWRSELLLAEVAGAKLLSCEVRWAGQRCHGSMRHWHTILSLQNLRTAQKASTSAITDMASMLDSLARHLRWACQCVLYKSEKIMYRFLSSNLSPSGAIDCPFVRLAFILVWSFIGW